MPVIIFRDRGWEVAAAAWTAAAKPGFGIRVCYAWGADSISWAQTATGISNVDIPITMPDFIARLKLRQSVIDLTDVQAER